MCYIDFLCPPPFPSSEIQGHRFLVCPSVCLLNFARENINLVRTFRLVLELLYFHTGALVFHKHILFKIHLIYAIFSWFGFSSIPFNILPFFSQDNFYLDLGLLFVLIAVFRLVAFIILYIRVKRSSAWLSPHCVS